MLLLWAPQQLTNFKLGYVCCPVVPSVGEFSASDSSLTDIQDTRRQPLPDPGLMPLPDTAADLDWSNLVDAAKAYEGE